MKSRNLIKLIPVLFFLSFAHIAIAQFNFGAGVSYIGRNNDFGIQAKAFTGLGASWAGAVGADLWLTEGLQFDINADAHYRITIGEDFRLNPLAGLNFVKRDNSTNVDIGINVGVFSFIPLQGRLNLYIEPKFTVSSLNSFVISSGVMF